MKKFSMVLVTLACSLALHAGDVFEGTVLTH